MASTFSKLCVRLSQHLVPVLLSAGYSGPSQFHRGEVRYQFKRRANDGTHVFSVLFDKYRRPAFSVQLFVEPPGGLPSVVSRGGTVVVGHLAPFYRPWPCGQPVFRAERPRWQRVFCGADSVESQAVDHCIALMPEVEAWWRTQSSSRHITVGRLVYKGVGTSAV